MHCLIGNSLPDKPRLFIEKQYYIYLLVFLLKMLVRYDFSIFFGNILSLKKLYSSMITFLYFNSSCPTVFPVKQTTWKKSVHASSKNALKSIQRFLFLFFNPLKRFSTIFVFVFNPLKRFSTIFVFLFVFQSTETLFNDFCFCFSIH